MTSPPLRIMEEAAQFEEWYRELERPFVLQDLRDQLPENLVTGVDNWEQPVHRWFNLKESYSSQLPLWVLKFLKDRYDADVKKAVDPFVGSGTTGVTLAQAGIQVEGVEYNPFIRLVAEAKSYYPCFNRQEIEVAIASVKLESPHTDLPVPELSTLAQPDYFRSSDIQIILHTVKQIRESSYDNPIKAFLLTGISAAIDDVANLRKDGRALRHIDKDNRPFANVAIHRRWKLMLEDLGAVNFEADFTVHKGTATDLSTLNNSQSQIDLILYSPPYLNNFDYSEILGVTQLSVT